MPSIKDFGTLAIKLENEGVSKFAVFRQLSPCAIIKVHKRMHDKKIAKAKQTVFTI